MLELAVGGAGLGLTQAVELRRREQVAVALDDGGLLGGLLLAHANGAALLRALVQIAGESFLELGRRQDLSDTHRPCEPTGVPAAHCGRQVLQVERLAEHRVDPRAHLRRDLARAREHHHAHRQVERLDVVEQVEAARAGDVDVEDDDVDPTGDECVARVRDGRGLQHAVALELQVHAAEQAERRLVVHDEDGFPATIRLSLHGAGHRSHCFD